MLPVLDLAAAPAKPPAGALPPGRKPHGSRGFLEALAGARRRLESGRLAGTRSDQRPESSQAPEQAVDSAVKTSGDPALAAAASPGPAGMPPADTAGGREGGALAGETAHGATAEPGAGSFSHASVPAGLAGDPGSFLGQILTDPGTPGEAPRGRGMPAGTGSGLPHHAAAAGGAKPDAGAPGKPGSAPHTVAAPGIPRRSQATAQPVLPAQESGADLEGLSSSVARLVNGRTVRVHARGDLGGSGHLHAGLVDGLDGRAAGTVEEGGAGLGQSALGLYADGEEQRARPGSAAVLQGHGNASGSGGTASREQAADGVLSPAGAGEFSAAPAQPGPQQVSFAVETGDGEANGPESVREGLAESGTGRAESRGIHGAPAPAGEPQPTPGAENPAPSAAVWARRFETVSRSAFEQMVRHVEGEVNGENASLKLQLVPGRLGEIELKLEVDRGIVAARFVAASEEVRALIESALPDLKRSLSEHGISVSELSVFVGQSQDQSRQGGEPAARGGSYLRPLGAVHASAYDAPAVEEVAAVIGPHGVDVLV